jgi:hypothetical protein
MTKETYNMHKAYMEQKRLIAEARKAAYMAKAVKAASNVTNIVRSQHSIPALIRRAEVR